jgi:hypothetical protein
MKANGKTLTQRELPSGGKKNRFIAENIRRM